MITVCTRFVGPVDVPLEDIRIVGTHRLDRQQGITIVYVDSGGRWTVGLAPEADVWAMLASEEWRDRGR